MKKIVLFGCLLSMSFATQAAKKWIDGVVTQSGQPICIEKGKLKAKKSFLPNGSPSRCAVWPLALKQLRQGCVHAQQADWWTTPCHDGLRDGVTALLSPEEVYKAAIAVLKEKKERESLAQQGLQVLEYFQSDAAIRSALFSHGMGPVVTGQDETYAAILTQLCALKTDNNGVFSDSDTTGDASSVDEPLVLVGDSDVLGNNLVAAPIPAPEADSTSVLSDDTEKSLSQRVTTKKETAIILTVLLSTLIAADYTIRGEKSLLARGLAKGKQYARTVMKFLWCARQDSNLRPTD